MRSAWRVVLVAWACGAAALVPAAVRAQDGGAPKKDDGATSARPTVAEGFDLIRRAAIDQDAAVLQKALPSSLVKEWTAQARSNGLLWRSDLTETLSKVTVTASRQAGDLGFVRWTTGMPRTVSELPLAWDGARWVVAAPWPYVVEGGVVATANGRAAGKVRLAARTSNGPYVKSAFSFTHVTQEPSQCKNRMDVWYCHNGDLHFSGGVQAAATPAVELREIDGIPADVAWRGTLPARKGTVYVVHCLHPGRMDFYVKARVTACSAASVELEWLLLAAGPNAPRSVRSPQPLVSDDGEDACHGLCARRGR